MYKIIEAPDRSSSHILEIDDIGKVIHISDCECTDNMLFYLSYSWAPTSLSNIPNNHSVVINHTIMLHSEVINKYDY